MAEIASGAAAAGLSIAVARRARSRASTRPRSTTRTCACWGATCRSAARSCRAASRRCRPRSSASWRGPSSGHASWVCCLRVEVRRPASDLLGLTLRVSDPRFWCRTRRVGPPTRLGRRFPSLTALTRDSCQMPYTLLIGLGAGLISAVVFASATTGPLLVAPAPVPADAARPVPGGARRRPCHARLAGLAGMALVSPRGARPRPSSSPQARPSPSSCSSISPRSTARLPRARSGTRSGAS